jgi:hypothetical protein
MPVKAHTQYLDDRNSPAAEGVTEMKCDWCEADFFQAKPWQRFCKPKHRDAWHNREKERRKIEAAEDRREDRINGHAASAERVDLVALGLAAKPVEVRRRKVA